MIDGEDMLERARERMGGKKPGKKKASKGRQRERELDHLQDEYNRLRYKEEIAIHRDIASRYKKYEDDPSVGGMYQMKAKTTKRKRVCKK